MLDLAAYRAERTAADSACAGAVGPRKRPRSPCGGDGLPEGRDEWVREAGADGDGEATCRYFLRESGPSCVTNRVWICTARTPNAAGSEGMLSMLEIRRRTPLAIQI